MRPAVLRQVNDASPERDFDRRGTIADAELRENTLDVYLDGELTDTERCGDLLVSQSLCYQFDDIDFAWRQRGMSQPFGKAGLDASRHGTLARMDLAHDANQIIRKSVL